MDLFRKSIHLISFYLVFGILFSSYAQTQNVIVTESYFSPRQGPLVFEKMYEAISSAKEEVLLTLYSWSDSKIKDSLLSALKNGANVKILLNPPLYSKTRVKDWIKELEIQGAEAKRAKMLMHEKILIVDNKLLINSSANMSNGPKRDYSENWIFHFIHEKTKSIFSDFSQEFALLWNSGTDIITHDENIADPISLDLFNEIIESNPNINSNAPFYSSSMNFKIKVNSLNSKDYKKGRFIKLTRKKNASKKQTWIVRDRILEELNKATANISCALNHQFIDEISFSLIEAVKRGVNVRLAVDNQELSSGRTKLFIREWKKLKGNKDKTSPVRFKFYSHKPSPAHWLLNHHKFCVIDYKTPRVRLINGSYNFSKSAEHNQFDNQVFYSTELYSNLYESFQEEFELLYHENRDEKDQPKQEILEKFYTPTEYGAYPLHNDNAVALTWKEVQDFKKKMNKLAPGITFIDYKKRNCLYYKFIKNIDGKIQAKFYGCPQY